MHGCVFKLRYVSWQQTFRTHVRVSSRGCNCQWLERGQWPRAEDRWRAEKEANRVAAAVNIRAFESGFKAVPNYYTEEATTTIIYIDYSLGRREYVNI